jgi:diacylglycerol kinase (ATP)
MKCVYVYNPKSGKQNNPQIREYVLTKLREKFDTVDCMPTRKRGDAGLFARQACGIYDVLVVSGGDGTVNEVVNAIAYVPDRPKIGYIPTGTTNDLAHSLKIPKNVKKAVKIILDGKYVSHDIFRVNDKYGIYVCAFGLFTGSSYGATSVSKKKFGRLAYFKYGIQELFGAKPFLVTLDFGENTFTGNYALGIIANSRYVAGYKINKMATCNDGYVNVILVNDKVKKGVSLGALLRIAKIFLFGMNSIKKTKNCIILKLNKFKMTLPEDAQINLDGEAGFKGSFDFEVLKQHIDIFVK